MLGRDGWLVRWSRLIFGYVAGQYELFAGWRSIDYQPGGADDCETRSDRLAAIDASTAMMLLAARGATTPYRNKIAPVAAPANIVTIDASLLFHRGLVPPAREESEASPVTV